MTVVLMRPFLRNGKRFLMSHPAETHLSKGLKIFSNIWLGYHKTAGKRFYDIICKMIKTKLQSRKSKKYFDPFLGSVGEVNGKKDGRGWRTIVDFTKIRKNGVPIDKAISALEELSKKKT